MTFHGPWNASGVKPGQAWDHTRMRVDPPYPNPFTSGLSASFSIPAEMPVRLRVFDSSGRLVRTLVDRTLAAGWHRFAWDGRDNAGMEAASGVYFLDLKGGKEGARTRLVRIR